MVKVGNFKLNEDAHLNGYWDETQIVVSESLIDLSQLGSTIKNWAFVAGDTLVWCLMRLNSLCFDCKLC